MAVSTLSTYAQALTSALGAPAHILDVNAQDSLPPFQFWFYNPPSKVSFEDTVCYTVGFADQSQGGACPYVELFFQFTGKYPIDQLNNLASILGGFLQEVRRRSRFTPNLLVRNLPIELLPGMRDILLVEGAGRRPLWVELSDRTIRVLSLVCLYPQEAAWCAEKSGFNTYHAFLDQGIDFLKPRRKSLEEFSIDFTGQQLARVLDLTRSTDPLSPEELWEEVREWYRLNAPDLGKNLTEDLYGSLETLDILLGVPFPDFPEEMNPRQARLLFLFTHWERIYAGAYEPTSGEHLVSNPHFVPPLQSHLRV